MKNLPSRLTVDDKLSVSISGLVRSGDAEFDRAAQRSTLDAHAVLFGDDGIGSIAAESKPKSIRELKDGIRALVRRRHARG